MCDAARVSKCSTSRLAKRDDLGPEQAQADRGGEVRPAGGPGLGGVVVVGAVAAARFRVEVVLTGLVAPLGLAALQGDEEPGQVPSSGRGGT